MLRSPSKHASLSFLMSLHSSHYLGAGGQEYSEEETQEEINRKLQKVADRHLKETLKADPEARSAKGPSDLEAWGELFSLNTQQKEERPMSIAIREFDFPIQEPQQDPSLSLAVNQTEAYASLVADLTQSVRIETRKAVDDALTYADDRARDVLERLTAKINALPKARSLVMAVEVNGNFAKLSRPAHPMLGKVIQILKTGENVFLFGPKGCGKTSLAEQTAEALGVRFGAISFTAGASEGWILGRDRLNGHVPAQFCDFYENGGLYLLDEVGAADSNTLMILQMALENGHFYNPITGKMLKRHAEFFCMAADNTNLRGGDSQYTARMRQDGAFCDRFVFEELEYSQEIETDLCPDEELRSMLWTVREAMKRTNMPQEIGSRDFRKAYKQKSIGVPMPDIIRRIRLGLGISENQARQIGLVA